MQAVQLEDAPPLLTTRSAHSEGLWVHLDRQYYHSWFVLLQYIAFLSFLSAAMLYGNREQQAEFLREVSCCWEISEMWVEICGRRLNVVMTVSLCRWDLMYCSRYASTAVSPTSHMRCAILIPLCLPSPETRTRD